MDKNNTIFDDEHAIDMCEFKREAYINQLEKQNESLKLSNKALKTDLDNFMKDIAEVDNNKTLLPPSERDKIKQIRRDYDEHVSLFKRTIEEQNKLIMMLEKRIGYLEDVINERDIAFMNIQEAVNNEINKFKEYGEDNNG